MSNKPYMPTEPPWLETIRRVQRQTDLASVALNESAAMRSIREINKYANLASTSLSQSELLTSIQRTAEISKLASRAFYESDAMRTIRELTESGRIASQLLHESEAIKSLRAVGNTSRIASLTLQQSDAAKQFQAIAKRSQIASTVLKQSGAFEQLRQLRKLPSFNALASLHNSPFAELLSIVPEPHPDDKPVTDDALLEIDSEINAEVVSEKDFNALSEKTKSILLYLYHYYILPILLSCLAAYIMTNALEARRELEAVSTRSQVKHFARSAHSSFDRTALKGFRVTTKDSLQFREAPSMKSGVTTTLPIGTLVEVMDQSHRSWLLVEVELNGVPEHGWILRRYTTYFK